MDIGIISSRYAKTLLKFALENGEADKVYEEASTLSKVFLQVPALKGALISPIVTTAQKSDLLAKAVVTENAATSQSFSQFVALVASNGRAELMPFIAEAFITAYRKHKGIIESRLVVATEVSDAVKERLQKLVESYSGQRVTLRTEINPEIGGGFVLYYDNYRFDASLRTKLKEMRQTLVK